MTSDYHDYVIKEGHFIGKFEEMYQNCDNPWPETETDIKNNPPSKRAMEIIKSYCFSSLLCVGSGKGVHLNWLQKNIPSLSITGIEVSKTAADFSRQFYPKIKVINQPAEIYLLNERYEFDVILFREVIWYLLPFVKDIYQQLLVNHKGKYMITELSFYDIQTYGNEYYNGMQDFIAKYPFEVIEIVTRHTSKNTNAGYLMLFAKI